MDQLLHTVNRQWFSQNIYIVVKCNLYILSGYSETNRFLYYQKWFWNYMVLHECGSMLWFIRLYTMTEIFAMSKNLVYRDKPINFKRLLSLNITNTNTHIRTHLYVCTNSTITFLESDHSSIWLRGPFLYHPLVWRKTNTSSICVFVSIFDDMLSCCQNKLWTLFFSRNW